jgi:deazaflavin-dependent oxidoreductase (nitroreductase family)
MWGLRSLSIRVVNPVTRLFAGRLHGFGLLTYRGRRSGRRYRTPVNVWPRGDEYTFILTYGSDAEWVKNVCAAGQCSIRVQGRDVRLMDPELIVDQTLNMWPGPAILRAIGRLGGVTELLRMHGA